MALNPVERRMALLCDHWLAFRAQPAARLLLWQVPENALRLVECFVEVQKLDLPYASGDVFLLVKPPYQHGLQFARAIKDSLRGQFDASRDDLQRQGLSADWDFDPAAMPDTPAGVAQALRSFGSRFHRQLGAMGHLVLVLLPPSVASLPAYLDWLHALLDTGLPERLRLLLVDTLEHPRLAALAEAAAAGHDPRLVQQQPAIDGLTTAQDTFAHEGGASPAAVFRNLMMGAVALAEKGSADQVKAKAADALAFARRQQWHDQEVALRILVAGALLKESRHAEALKVYAAARAAAQHTVQAAHPAGQKLLLQTWFGEAGVHLAAGDERAAAACYEEAAVVAQRDANPILAIEACRMAGWCLARAGDREPALQRLGCAVDLGAALKPEARAMTTLPVALVDMLRTLEAPRVERMQLAKGRLQQALDGIGQRSEARGAQLTAAGVAGALAIVDQERAQQAEAAAAEARAAIDAAAQGAGAPFQQVLARGQGLLGVDWLVDNDTALPPLLPAQAAKTSGGVTP